MKPKTFYKKENDALDKAIDKYSMKKWGRTYQKNWEAAYKEQEYESLRQAIREEVKGYMEMNNMTAKEAVEALRRSRYYVSQEDFYQNATYKELKDLGVNRDTKTGKFISFKKENIEYRGYVTIGDQQYKKYSFIADGKTKYMYTNLSPKAENYAPLITEESYE